MYLNEDKILADARRFFLGQMAEGERTSFETDLIANADVFDLVRVSEDELLEQYSRGLLSRNERRSFESTYLANAANRQRASLTNALISKVSTPTFAPGKVSLAAVLRTFFFQNKLALGSALGIALVLGAIWFTLPRESGTEIARDASPANAITSTPGPSPAPTVNPQSVANEPPPTHANVNRSIEKPSEPKPRTPVLALFAGTLRDGGKMPTLSLGNGVQTANLSLNLEIRDYDRYRAEIVDPDGNVIYRSGTMKPNGKKISLSLPTANVKNGEYSVRLSGVTKENSSETAADFSFRVIRK